MKNHAAMNRIYRLVWSQVLNAWVAVAENAKGRGKAISRRKLIAATLALAGSALLAPLALAAPTGGQVSAGSGAIAQAGATTTITQSSQNLAINWQGFSIAANEAVRFNQPNATAIALNRVLGQDPSQILGSLSANGQVFILNPNGVLFGTGSQVNVGGLVASTLSLGDADFMAGKHSFGTPLPQAGEGQGRGSVINQGTLTATQGGYIALLAPEVRNEGVIRATLGTALLAAGDKVTLTLNNGSLLSYSIDQGALNALADNKQLIQADGGQVFMSAKAANALTTAMVNNTGIIEARTVQNVAGVIMLMGDMQVGQVNVGGTLDASAPNGGNGGFVETSAAHVKVADDAKVTTAAPNGNSGTWLIDPTNFTIAAGGGALTTSGIGATTLSNNLGNTSVIIATAATGAEAGDIFVNSAVTWAANKLTLSAHNNININANLNASGTASLALEYGQGAIAAGSTSNYILAPNVQVDLPAGPNFSTKLGSDGVVKNFTVITSLGAATDATGGAATLQGMAATANLASNYALGSNINAADTSIWNTNEGFTPIGDGSGPPPGDTTAFTGTFAGLGHTISNLTINRPTTEGVGLFGHTGTDSAIRNVGLVGGSVSGMGNLGGLVGSNSGTVSNSYFTGSVIGNNNATGGLVGSNSGTVSNSYATGSVSGGGSTGGLVGSNVGTVSNSYATSSVIGSGYSVGGLVGSNYGSPSPAGSGTVSNSYATGSVSGTNEVGGLVGTNYGSAKISSSYATGSVYGSLESVGGLVGDNSGGTTVSSSYATGNVSGSNYVGGLVGINQGTVSNSYATGNVIWSGVICCGGTGPERGGDVFGGLVGYNVGSITNSYATGGVDGGKSVGGLVGYNDGTVFNSYATGGVIGVSEENEAHGGLVGNNRGSISNSYATGSVDGGNSVGGLVGYNDGTVYNSYATGDVGGANEVGGLVGTSYGAVTYSYATGNVSGVSSVGGLVGYSDNSGGVVGNSYATGNVSGTDSVGGLVGDNSGGGIINSYATGRVIGDSKVGGLVGGGYGPVDKSYATGLVGGTSNVGGLLGFHDFSGGDGSVTNSFWDSDVNPIGIGSSTPGDTTGVTGRTSAQMMSMSTFSSAGWSISNTGGSSATWRIYEGQTTPWLTWWLKPVTVTLNSDTRTYSGALYSGGNGYAVGNPAPSLSGTFGSPNPALSGTLAYGGNSQSAVNAGGYILSASGLYSVQQGYDISYVDGALTINRANLTLSGTRVYDGLTAYAGANLTATGVAGETFAIGGTGNTGNLVSANVQTGSTLASLAGLTLGIGSGGGLSSNYNALSTSGSSVNVTAANLTVTADNKSRLYGQANPALTTTVSGFVNNETAGTAAGFTGAGSATTLAGLTTNVGTAAITAGAGNLAATNYAFTNLVNGALTINPAEIITPVAGGILPAVIDAIIALPGGADLLPAFSSTVTVAATQIDAVAPPPALANLQYVYVTTTTPGTLSGDIDTTVGGEAAPIKAQSNKSDGFNERLADAPVQFTGTVLVRNGGINLPGDADDANARDKKQGNK